MGALIVSHDAAVSDNLDDAHFSDHYNSRLSTRNVDCESSFYEGYPARTVGQYGTYCPNGDWYWAWLTYHKCYNTQCERANHNELVENCLKYGKSKYEWDSSRPLCSVWADYVVGRRNDKDYEAKSCPAKEYKGGDIGIKGITKYCPNG